MNSELSTRTDTANRYPQNYQTLNQTIQETPPGNIPSIVASQLNSPIASLINQIANNPELSSTVKEQILSRLRPLDEQQQQALDAYGKTTEYGTQQLAQFTTLANKLQASAFGGGGGPRA